jgi:hypothetical protein
MSAHEWLAQAEEHLRISAEFKYSLGCLVMRSPGDEKKWKEDMVEAGRGMIEHEYCATQILRGLVERGWLTVQAQKFLDKVEELWPVEDMAWSDLLEWSDRLDKELVDDPYRTILEQEA